MYDHEPEAAIRARRLRKDMSLPEMLLWRLLRAKPMGVKFRRQHPIGDFVVDFYCHQARTVIEIDGISHDMGDQPGFDTRRDGVIAEMGNTIVRIPARDVLSNPAAVAESLVALCLASPFPSALSAAISPRGEDLSGVCN